MRHRSVLMTLAAGAAGTVVAMSLASGTTERLPQGTNQAALGDPVASFTSVGELVRPEGYRRWVFIGTSVTPNDMNGGRAVFPEFHNVYLDPQSFEHYAETGEYRDGAVLVKELLSVGTKESASGAGYFQGDFRGLGVMVKDAARFPRTPGNWGYFDFTDPPRGADGSRRLQEVAVDVSSSCIDCHNAAASTDYVFTKHYPIMQELRPSRPSGTSPRTP